MAAMHPLVQPDLLRLEVRLAELLRSDVEFIELIGSDLVAAGGKRFRPLFAFLVARALLPNTPNSDAVSAQVVDWAAALELLHSASLLHDDLIDDAATRRGREAAFRRFGNAVSVFSGDYMLANVLRVLADLPPGFTRLIGDTARAICEGEVLQFQVAALETYSIEHYLQIISGKTAVLLAAATGGAARLAGADSATEQALYHFGLEYGRAFQMQDDLLDLMGDPGDLGKPVGSDLREGKATLPVLYLFASNNSEARQIVARRASAEGDVERMRQLVVAAPANQPEQSALAQVRAEIARRVALAREHLLVLPASQARTLLEGFLDQESVRNR
jgi:octaprenyl-diphosphate synthase